MSHTAHFFLYFEIKSFFAPGAGGAVLAFYLRKPKGCMAGGAPPVGMGLTILPLVFLQAEKVLDAADGGKEFTVLLCPLDYVTG